MSKTQDGNKAAAPTARSATGEAATLDRLAIPCEVCGREATLPRYSADEGARHGAIAGDNDTGPFWACKSCNDEVSRWPAEKIRSIVAAFRSRHSRPRRITVSLDWGETGGHHAMLMAASAPAGPGGRSAGTADGPNADELAAYYALDAIKGFGPQKFKTLHERGVSWLDVVRDPECLHAHEKSWKRFTLELLKLLKDVSTFRQRAEKQIDAVRKNSAAVVTYGNPAYPRNVYDSNNPIPVLFVRGSLDVLRNSNAVACVGSRNVRSPYSDLEESFAKHATKTGFVIASGFALGADSIGHRAAFSAGGQTVCVMPSGLDRPFPPENRGLWDTLLNYGRAAFVSEFPFGTPAASLTLRKRNKLIVAFAKGVLIAQSAEDGGAMNAYRFGLEQRKALATFASDGREDTSGNALISRTRKANATVFQLDASAQEFAAWLSLLSSAT